jgi:predicted transcriptional regulator of viral defense system
MKLSEIEKLAIEVAELATREVALAAEMSDVATSKAEKLRQLASGSTASVIARAVTTVRAAPSGESGAKERVYQALNAKPSHVFTSNELVKSLGMNRSTASVYLSELAKDDRIDRVSNGRYRARRTGAQHPPAASAPRETFPDRIIALFASDPGAIYDAPAIAAHFGVTDAVGLNSIRGALSRLNRDGKIRKSGRGDYTAAEENPIL